MGTIKINNIIYGSNLASDIIYNNTTVQEKLDTIPIFDINDNGNVSNDNSDYLTYGHIIDNLNSDANDKVLSANQGKVLSEKIDNIDLSYLEDGIASLGTSIDELDINKANNDDVNTLTERVDNLYINSGYGRIRFKWDDSTGYLRAAVDNTENVANFKGHVTVPFSFGVDANGNYGYIKDGADSVTPFNNLSKVDLLYEYTGRSGTGVNASYKACGYTLTDAQCKKYSYYIYSMVTQGCNCISYSGISTVSMPSGSIKLYDQSGNLAGGAVSGSNGQMDYRNILYLTPRQNSPVTFTASGRGGLVVKLFGIYGN